LSDILNGLTNLRLGPQPILADRTNVQEVPRKANVDEIKQPGRNGGNEPIVISSESETRDRVPRLGGFQPSKAHRLRQLADRASNATDNGALSRCVREFEEILQMNSSRTLTKEAFYFLDVLFKQLDDPSVFVKPTRTSRHPSFNEQVPEKEPSHVKLGVVAHLRREVHHCTTNKALAAMVSDFAKVTNKSTGRTITKDGFAFLDGLSERLKVLQ
jgi:casein kinase 1